MRILLVDDHAETLRAFQLLLQLRGHVVTTASSIAAARCLLRADPFDVLLCDLGLPDGDGRDLTELARQRQVRAIAVSGYQPADVPDRMDGFQAHLVKPVSFEAVEAVLDGPAR